MCAKVYKFNSKHTPTGVGGRRGAGAGAEQTRLDREVHLCVPEKAPAPSYLLPGNWILTPDQEEVTHREMALSFMTFCFTGLFGLRRSAAEVLSVRMFVSAIFNSCDASCCCCNCRY